MYLQENEILHFYREAFPDVARYIHRRGGTQEDAKDIFHDAFLVFLERKAKGTLAIYSSPRAYIAGIAKILWLHRQQRIDTSQLPEEVAEFTEDNSSNQAQPVMNYLQLAGERCLQLLKTFYYDNLSMQDIASRFGFSGPRSATVQKFKCLEKIRNQIKFKTGSYAE